MRHGINVCTLGELADPARIVEIACAAEEAGWEAMFVWDHLAFAWGVPSADPWVVLAAAAQATSRIRLGAAVTPLPRRRPAVLAGAVATLDRLSNGRAILGAGAGGVPAEFTAFGEAADPRLRAAKLDEALEVVAALLTGDPVNHTGPHYTVEGVSLAPPPVQRPRVPIWVGGNSRPALRRAARWDGWIGAGDEESGAMALTPEAVAGLVAYLRDHRDHCEHTTGPPPLRPPDDRGAGPADVQADDRGAGPADVQADDRGAGPADVQDRAAAAVEPATGSPAAADPASGSTGAVGPVAGEPVGRRNGGASAGAFAVALIGVSAGPDDEVLGRYEAAGVTWRLEHLHGRRAGYERLLERVAAGPPR